MGPFGEVMEKRKSFVTILSNAGWLTGTRLAGNVVSVLLFVVLSRYFGPAGIGQYAYGLAIAGLIGAVVAFGLEDYAIRESSHLSLEARRLLLSRLLGTQLGIIALAVFGLLVFLLIARPSGEVVFIIILLSSYHVALAVSWTLFVPAFSQQSMAGPAITEFICRAGITGGVIMLVVGMHTSLSTALIPFPLGGLLLVVLAAASARRHNKSLTVRVHWHESTMIVRSVWPFAASLVVDTMYSRAGLIMLSLFIGDATAGIYASSIKFLEVGAIPLVFLGFAVYPTLSILFKRSDQTSLTEAIDSFHRAMLIAGGLLAWALFFLVPLVLVPLLGESFADAVPVVRLLAILGVVMALDTTAVRLLFAMHLQIRMVKLQFLGLVLLLALNFIMIPRIGIIGAVAAMIVASTGTTLMYYIALQSRIKIMPLVKSACLFFGLLGIAFLAGAASTWLSASPWLPSLTSLAMLAIGILVTSFLPIRKLLQA